ncbi:unnamed protein product [marine sediment metagenome]|uniref:Uncharacterized protein n=1 Tax=marine sediment metagenome TaxID=412755 RepID=X1AZT2_9ZZZZ
MEFVLMNWEYFLLGFYILEKIVHLTPTKKDDVIFDMIVKPLWNKFLTKKVK